MSKREYTTEFKREVLAMAAKGEKSISELERDLGIGARLGRRRGLLAFAEHLPCTGDLEALVVEQGADLPDDDHILTLIVAAVATPLDGLELGKLLLPVAQHVGLDVAQFAHLTDGEVAFRGDGR